MPRLVMGLRYDWQKMPPVTETWQLGVPHDIKGAGNDYTRWRNPFDHFERLKAGLADTNAHWPNRNVPAKSHC
jgi:hypothetical protein